MLSSSGVTPLSPDTLQALESKHPFAPAPILPSIPCNEEALSVSKDEVLRMIHSFPKGTSCGRDGLRAQHLKDKLGGAASAIADSLLCSIIKVVNLLLGGKCPSMLRGFIASAPLTSLVKPGGDIHLIVVGTVWWQLVSKVRVSVVGKTLHTYFEDFQFGVGTQGGGEAILHSVNRLVKCKGDVVGFSMLLVDFQNAFNLVNQGVMLSEIRMQCPSLAP